MSAEKAAGFFRAKESLNDTDVRNISDWEAILVKLKSYDPNDGNFYMIRNTSSRSRFLTYTEAVELITYVIEKKNHNES